jgi:hypothetical protein
MSKKEIDYSNTIIYKIYCNDPAVTDVYVGHTINFVQRKHAHKQSCSNLKTMNYKCKVYEVIRNNGGWSNWKMEIVNFYNCRDHYEARQKEQEYFVSLKATLNSIEPMPKPKVIVDKVVTTNTKKLNLIVTKPEKVQTVLTKFSCVLCHYFTSRRSQYDRHLNTSKHIKMSNVNKMEPKSSSEYKCSNCDKVYKDRSGLWKHNKTCIEENNQENIVIEEEKEQPKIKILTNLVLEVVKNNSELQKQTHELKKQMLELYKQIPRNDY